MSNKEGNGKSLSGKQLYAFEGFLLDTSSGLLTHSSQPVKLAPKVFQLLVYLIENRDRIASKNEIFEEVWQDTFVEDNALSYTISQLRKTLAAYEPETAFIETVPRRGFRFVSDVRSLDPNITIRERTALVVERQTVEETWIEEIDGDGSKSNSHSLQLQARHSFFRSYSVPLLTLALVVLIGAGFATWNFVGADRRMALSEVRSIAVLPLSSFGSNGDEVLGIRLADSLITKLGRLDSILVRPTSSVTRYVNSDIDPLEIGRKLQVDAVLSGKFQVENDSIRITLQLVSVKNGSQVWADQFDGEVNRLLVFQDSVATQFLNSLNVSAEQASVLAGRPTSNNEAFEEYSKGRYFWNKRTPESLRSSISAFQKAITLDPNFSEAYAGLADSYFLLVDYGYENSMENVRSANQFLDKALALNPNLANAFATRGHIQSSYEWRWHEAEASLVKAKSMEPNSPNTHHRFGMLLLKLSRFAEAEQQMLRAKELDPTSPGINMNLGVIYFFSKRHDEAVDQFKKTIELDEKFSAPRWYLARCLWMMGDLEGAVREYANAARSVGDEDSAKLLESNIAAPRKAIEMLIANWKSNMPANGISHSIAILYATLGRTNETIEWLERCVSDRHAWASMINAEPEFDLVREDPRFLNLLSAMNLR